MKTLRMESDMPKVLLLVLSSVCLSGFALAQLPQVGLAGGKLDYNRDIRPILSESCFPCHGFDEKTRQASLRLDVMDVAYSEREGRTAISPGSLEKSEAWMRVLSTDEEQMMPPPTSHFRLSDLQKSRIKQWIEEGAPYAGHWAFISPKKGNLPAGTSNHPIDRFVESRLAEQGLSQSPEADKAMLIRRLSLDLTGLPPSAQEVEVFVHSSSADAYPQLVDRLLASPHFGERLAIEWLDSARYADTNGFSIDGGRHQWLWRDWVIQAFNDNLPYDRFLMEQLAGDLLPDRTDAQKIATGFQRNNMVTHEGGTIAEENLTNYNADRVKTLGESVLGLTLGCAQCHDHKYDPLSQREYYQMFAFFNSLSDKAHDGDGGVNPGPIFHARTVLKTNEESLLIQQIATLKSKMANVDDAIFNAWEARELDQLARRGFGMEIHPIKTIKVSTPNRGAGFEAEGENRVRLKDPGGMGAFDIATELPKLKGPMTGFRVTMHPVDELPGGGWGKGMPEGYKPKKQKDTPEFTEEKTPKGTFMLTAIAVTADKLASDQVNLFRLLSIKRVTANSWTPGREPVGSLHPLNTTGWSPDLQTDGPVHITATFAEPIDSTATPFFTVQLNFGNGRNQIPELIELNAIVGTDDGTDLPKEILEALAVPKIDRTHEQTTRLWNYCASHAIEFQSQRTDLLNLQDRLDVLTKPFPTMVMDVASKPRETFVLHRGDYSQPAEKVEPGTPAILPAFPGDAPADRLGLARWLTQKDHPLTSRVAVNRFWKMLFGVGIVSSPADFGAQGEWPSHPELLDWLAVDFVESGWDTKAIIKSIVLSATYRQTSAATSELLAHDPQNRWLARGPRFRLGAELIRDSALKVSGLLVPRIGGPSVNPYSPGDLWREISHYGSSPATSQTFVQDHGEKLYRRSLYTYWKRTAPPPNMMAFDAPNREVCTVSRGNTTTPMQALVTLNDTQFVEAARAFAQRIIMQAASSDEERLRWAFIESTSRNPSFDESKVLLGLLARERARYASNANLVASFLSVGESPINSDISLVELASWSQVASLLLNLSESLTRN
jgi:hypothetical protein